MSKAWDEIKRLIPIASLLNTHKDLIRCPMPNHEDKNPSCAVFHDEGRWKCFSCGEYGDIFDLIEKRDRMDKGEALRHLADMAGVTLDNKQVEEWEKQREQRQRIDKAMAYAAEYYHQNLLEHKGGLAYLESRGIDVETIQRLKLGWSDGRLVLAVKKAKLEGFGLEDFIAAGLIRESDRKPGTHYDYFDIRIIFPLLHRGRVLNMSGRKTDLSSRDGKYLHLAKLETDYFYNEEALSKEVWLFEGHPDTVTAIQCGLPAMGVIGTNGMKHPEKLKSCDKIYICGDADKAGVTAADKWATAILKHHPACTILFVSLTGGAKDFNEWYVANRGPGLSAKFDAMTANAKNLIEFRIAQLKSSDDLGMVWPLLKSMPEILQESYLQKIKGKLGGIGITLLRKSLNAFIQEMNARQKSADAALTGVDFTPLAGSQINIAFTYGSQPSGHICQYGHVKRVVDGKEDINYEPVLIRSQLDKGGYIAKIVPVRDSELAGNVRTQPTPSIVSGRWSNASIQRFIAGQANESTAALIRDITAYFRKYIWHRDPVTYEVFALYAMGTYAARLFGSYPYMAINGLAGSGKSNILELFEQLCFNALLTVSISPAALYRAIEMNCPTCLRDEAEQFNKRTDENQDELTILNSGYKQGAKVRRMEKDKNGAMDLGEFDVFSPKIFAGINMLNDVLMTRSILIKTHKAPKNVITGMPQMNQTRTKWQAEGAALRDRMHCWILTRFAQVKDLYENYPPIAEIANRDWEVWLPILTLAGLADMEGGEEVLANETLTERIMRYATGKAEDRKASSKENTIHMKVLDTILQLMDEFEISHIFMHPNWYVMASVATAVDTKLHEEGFFSDRSKFTPRWLSSILEDTQVISDRKAQIKDIKEVGKTKRCVLLEKAVIEDALANL